MEYQVGTIRQSNIQAHDDIETDILTLKDGLFTFVLRINGGNIVDYNMVEYVNVREVLSNPLIVRLVELQKKLDTQNLTMT